MKFEWDNPKAEKVARERGIPFPEAASVFDDANHIRREDAPHSIVEKRESLIGTSSQERVLFVSFTMRDAVVRIITARMASRKERRLYEELKK